MPPKKQSKSTSSAPSRKAAAPKVAKKQLVPPAAAKARRTAKPLANDNQTLISSSPSGASTTKPLTAKQQEALLARTRKANAKALLAAIERKDCAAALAIIADPDTVELNAVRTAFHRLPPIIAASIELGTLEVLKALIATKQVDVNAIGGARNNVTALGCAITGAGDCASAVEALIAAGADVNRPSIDLLPIVSAVISGNVDVVKLLLGASADISACTTMTVNYCGRPAMTLLDIAKSRGNAAVIQALMEAGRTC